MKNYFKYITAIMLFSFVLMNSKTEAHAVQVGYCVNCNGDLRIWIEHWHGSANPNTTTMTLQINVGGIITSYTASPDTSVLNVTVGNLPGCFTPMTVFSQCQGTGIYAPNSHNDWVAYDFFNLQCAVPITITMISGNSAFTMDCGNPVNMFPVSSNMFSVPCMADIDTCAGNTIGPFAFPNGNTWTNSNTAIGLGASGNGNIPAFVGAYNSTVQTAIIVTSNSTCGIDSFNITVHPAAQVNFDAIVGCPGQPVTFINNTTSLASPITNWLWDFGDGSPNDIIQNPAPHTFPGAGPYMVTLTVTTANGCVNDTVVPVFPLGGLIVGFYAASVCDGSPTTFVDTTNGVILKYEWDFDNDGIVDDTTQSPTFTFPGPGTYNVKLHVDAQGGCEDSIVVPIIVNPNPIPLFTPDDVCFPAGTNTFTDGSTVTPGATYAWDFGDGFGTSALQSPTYQYGNPGNYYVTLTITTDSGCTASYSDTARANNTPIANFTTGDVCSNAPAIFTDNSNGNGGTIVLWEWDFDNDGNIDDNNQSTSYLFPVVGVQSVKLIVTTQAGCKDSITLPVTIKAYPTADFDLADICLDSISNFTDLSTPNGGALQSWDWDFGTGSTSNLQNPSELYATAGTYTVQLATTSTDGCTDTIVKQITIHPKPDADFILGPQPTTTYDPEIFFSDESMIATVWDWDFGDGGFSNDQNPSHEYADSGSYQVTLHIENRFGCKDTTDHMVRIDPVFVIFIPNSFTPDGDGMNDFFFPSGFGYQEIKMQIYDRWGEVIYEGNSVRSKWDGLYKGSPIKGDSYVYKINIKDVLGAEHEYIGKVTVIQ